MNREINCRGAAGDTDEAPYYLFADDDFDTYTRVDRIGMPAINTAVITSKDAYNQADPVDDAAGDFVAEITTNVTALHTALDDDLAGHRHRQQRHYFRWDEF